MPCSRSARSPSVSSARFMPSSPRSFVECSSASSVSSKICFESYSNRPMSVDLPSSTDPAVAKRSSSISRCPRHGGGSGCGAFSGDRPPPLCSGGPHPPPRSPPKAPQSSPSTAAASEITLAFAVFHRGFTELVVGSCCASLGDAGRGDFGDDVVDLDRDGLECRGARGVADRAVPDHCFEHFFIGARLQVLRDGHQHAVAAEDFALVGEVDRWELDLLLGDVLPDVELGPVRQWEHADVLALAVASVVDAPQLGPLVLRIPLAEV